MNQINPYLIEGKNIFIKSKRNPISDVSPMVYGNKVVDGGNFFLTSKEKDEFISKEPLAKNYIHRVYGAREFINNTDRYCLWLENITPHELRKMATVMERVKKVREFRLASKKKKTREQATTSHLFSEIRQPETDYLLVPRVSSENRRYVPIGFMSHENIVTDAVQIVPDATLYEFGVITSNVHMAWMRTVAGRLEMRYRYSATLVYNTFPWPNIDENQKNKIEKTAQSILDARALYPGSSLADLYHELTMPVELRKAHQANDKSVMEAYGMKVGDTTESESVAQLFKIYEKLTSSE